MHVMPGEIKMWPSTVLPTGWLFCNGQTLDISAYTPLFNIIGNRYGGDGITKFRLPDYRGKIICGGVFTTDAGTVSELCAGTGLTQRTEYTATQQVLPATTEWSAVCYGNNIWIAVSYTNPSVVAKSTDGGKTWSQKTIPGGYYKSVKYGNGVFVALAQGNTTATSTDGETWTLHTHAFSSYWSSMDYGDGYFIAVAVLTNMAIRSTDGINWTQLTMPVTANWNAICFGENGTWVAVTDGAPAARTTDNGNTWSSFNMPSNSNWLSVAYGNKIFLAVGLNGGASNIAATTSNMGVTWTARELPEYDIWFTVTFGNGVFVLAAYLSDKALTTTNGLVWTQRALPVSTTWYNVGYGNKNFVAVGYGTATAALIDGISNSPQMIDTNFIISYTGQVVSY